MPSASELMQSGAMPAGISPDMLQQVMQQAGGMSGGDITNILAQLAQMSPEEVSSALASLGVQVDPNTLHEAAANWVDQAAGKASGASGDDGTTNAAEEGDGGPGGPSAPNEPAPSSPSQDDEQAEPVADNEQVEGEADTSGMDAMAQGAMPPGVGPGGPSPDDVALAQSIIAKNTGGGGGAMPRGVVPGVSAARGAESPIQQAISASLGGDVAGLPMRGPRAPSAGGPNMRSPASPSAMPKAGAGSQQDMIRAMYRQAAAKDRGVAQTGVKRGPRTGGSGRY